MSVLSLQNISFSYGSHSIFANKSFTFPIGGCSALMAPSGKGKTTLLFLIAGLLQPDKGSIQYGAKKGYIYQCSMVFQEGRLLENLSVKSNIHLVTENLSDAELQKLFASLGLIPDTLEAYSVFVRKKVCSLSGGEKQRLAIARALLAKYDVLLLDEPFTGLDENSKEQVAAYMREHSEGKTVIMVTHDEEEAVLLNADVYQL